MIESRQGAEPSGSSERTIEFSDSTFLVDAALIGDSCIYLRHALQL